MNAEELKQEILTIEPSVNFEEGVQFLNAVCESQLALVLLTELRNRPTLSFDYLFCLTCVDYKTHFTVFYHLRSMTHRHEVVVKAKIADVNNPAIDSVWKLWRGAEFLEREVYDLFGVKFYKHPDLRRIFLDENWPGWPLRKNYEDPNMIEL